MTIKQILTFTEVAKHLNLTRASAELKVSQSCLTQQVRRLEAECRTKLYQKTMKGILLTREGEIFLRHARNILTNVRMLKEDFSVISPEKSKSLAVGSNAADSPFLLKALATFRKTHPDVQLTLRTDTSLALERMLLASELDIAVINNIPRASDLLSKLYRQDKLVAFAPINHPLAKRKLMLPDLAKAPLVIVKLQPGATTFVEQLFENAEPRLKPNIVLRCESPEDVKAAVRANMGIGVLLARSVKAEIAAGKFSRMKLSGVNLNMPSFIIHRSQQFLPAHARDFVGLLYRRGKK